MKIKLLLLKNKLENERKIEQIEQSRKKLIYYIGFISVFSILLILFLLLINQRNKVRHTQLKIEHLSRGKKQLNNELTNLALHISTNNLLLEEVRQSLKYLSVDKKNDARINDLKLKLNTGLLNAQNKKILEQKVDDQHHEFVQLLKAKHPLLTKSELWFCSLLKLNLSTKDIAAIRIVSPQAVKMARYRLRKKLQLGSETNISDYLNKL